MKYCSTGQYEEALKILKEGKDGYPAEVNSKGLDDWRPLHFASYEGYDDIVDLLLQHGADINASTIFNRNALHIAAIRGFLEVIKILCERKIELNAVDNDGNTALHIACQNGYK